MVSCKMLTWPRVGPWLSAAILSMITQGVSQSIPSPNLKLDDLGKVTLVGNFDAISLYQYLGQTEGFNSNGTQSVLSEMADGLYKKLASTDASIEAMCPFVLRNGTLVGLIVGGNFTSIGGVDARSIALIDPRSQTISPHVGIEGSVTSMLCDRETETVYIGGTFEASVSTNAITWIATGSWANLPFQGFDGPVNSITRAPNGHIIFGGSFTGLGDGNGTVSTAGNSSTQHNQIINLGGATITSTDNTTSGGNIICPTNTTNGSSTPWLLRDGTAGSWQANMRYGYQPSRLRLWNTRQDGRGTRTWRFTALPDTGILNMTYTDPATGRTAYCDATCPLSQNASLLYQDFFFVNSVGMNSFRIDVSDWYGSGGGLDGIEIFQDDIYAYAIESFNQPACAGTQTISAATVVGSWSSTPSHTSNADYLTAVTGPTTVNTTEIVFEPDIKQNGNYSVIVYTPGCLQDSSCSARAIVNVTGSLTTTEAVSFSDLVYQTNNNDKYDIVYTGRIETATGSFRPRVTIRPSGLQTDQLIVASKVRFSLINSTGGLNGLFDYDPNQAVVDVDFSKSAINTAGTMLKPNAQIMALATHDNTIYAAGQFTDDSYQNIMSFADNQASSLPEAGLNAGVASIYSTGDFLYVGGNFTGTTNNGPSGLSNVAAYRYSDRTWVALGAGLNGAVDSVAPLPLNISSTVNETCIAFSGSFSSIIGGGSTASTRADGFAVWVPSRNSWLENLSVPKSVYAGRLSAYTILPNGTWIGAGTLTSLGQAVSGAIGLTQTSSGNVRLQQLPISIAANKSSTTSLSKRALTGSQTATGVVTGIVYDADNRNVTVLAGHFSATGNNSAAVENLMFVNGSNSNTVTGLPAGIDSNSTFSVLAISNSILIAGGRVTGEVGNARIDGLVLYDFAIAGFRALQPATLVNTNGNVTVYAVASQPKSSNNIYVGGSFEQTGQGLSCRSVCMYDTNSNQWNTVGGTLSGVVAALYWTSDTTLLAVGSLAVSGSNTSLATYDVKQQTWSARTSSNIPGPIEASTPVSTDANRLWIAGTANNGSTYLMELDNENYRPVVGAFGSGTTIRSLQLLPTQSNHGPSQYLDKDKELLVMGSLNLTGFGAASAALFNGTTFTPFILASTAGGGPGSISQILTAHGVDFGHNTFRHSRGIAILVALCAALGTIFLIILVGVILNKLQRRRNGYNTLPSVPYTDKNSNLSRVPPERLFGSLGQRGGGVPQV